MVKGEQYPEGVELWECGDFATHTFIEILVAYQILRATNNLCIKFYFRAAACCVPHVGRPPKTYSLG